MKYYVCIKEVEGNIPVQNWFITYTFYSGSNGSTGTYNQLNTRLFYKNSIYKVYEKGANNEAFIVDNVGNHHKLEDLKNNFRGVKVEIDEETEKLIEKKGRDNIFITPTEINDEGEVLYLISCRAIIKGIACWSQRINASIYDGIINCFREIRKGSDNTQLWYDVVRFHKKTINKRRR